MTIHPSNPLKNLLSWSVATLAAMVLAIVPALAAPSLRRHRRRLSAAT